MSFWWDLQQDQRIGQVSSKASGARSQAQTAQDQAEQLESRLEALMLANAAMWSLMRERLGVTDAELIEKMRQIDLLDGKADGKMSPRVVECSACKRTMSTRFRRCVYCGTPIAGGSPFPGV
jgi:hypothetical protein